MYYKTLLSRVESLLFHYATPSDGMQKNSIASAMVTCKVLFKAAIFGQNTFCRRFFWRFYFKKVLGKEKMMQNLLNEFSLKNIFS